MNIPFSPPDIGENEINEVVECLRSGWITTGPRTKQFEKMIAEYCGTDKAVCLNSATACMELTLMLLGVGEGDEVITSAYTYTSSASVVCHVGAKLVMVDTAPDSFIIDYDRLEKAINEKTKVIIPVDIGGVMCDYDRIREIVERKKHLFKAENEIQKAIGHVIIMSDSAHSFGSEYKGKINGSLADFTCFSFHAVKNLTTAEGGAVTWRDIKEIDNDVIYKTYMNLSLHGQTKDAFSKMKLGSWEYDIIKPYYKCNMTDISASIGIAQLKRYDSILERRRTLARKYNNALRDINVKHIEHSDNTQNSNCHLYMVSLTGKNCDYRNKLIKRLAEKGIATNVHFKPLPMHSAYKELGFKIEDYPNAYKMFETEITLPLNSVISDEEAEYLLDTFIKETSL